MSDAHAVRTVGLETEYGIYRPGQLVDQQELSLEAVKAYYSQSRAGLDAPIVQWDYAAESPLQDLRGFGLSEVEAPSSMQTSDPWSLAPSGGNSRFFRPSSPSSIAIANGGRLYVDHAHPEYSSPETQSAADAVRWDRAGEVIAQRIMDESAKVGKPLVLVKNNVDGKGASYGAHENYLVPRDTDLDDLVSALIPFLVTRPVFCGSGRVGIGQRSEISGFQISQRADYIEALVGLETTHKRPIFNTRDEPHAEREKWRRLHVIVGDANLFDFSTYLRVGVTKLVLWAVEQGTGLEWDGLGLADAVGATRAVSRDLSLNAGLAMASGATMTALEIQRVYRALVQKRIEAEGAPWSDAVDVMRKWEETLNLLSEDLFAAKKRVEWVGKLALLRAQQQRLDCSWDDPRLKAIDLQWADLRKEKSLVEKLRRHGMVDTLWSDQDLHWAADNPPQETRALVRGRAVRQDRDLMAASWTELVYAQEGHTRRYNLLDPNCAQPPVRQ